MSDPSNREESERTMSETTTIITLEEAVAQTSDLDEVHALLPQYPAEDIQQCVHCDDIDHTDVLHYTERNGWVCEDCLRDDYTACERCGEYEYDDYNSDVEDETWCEDCAYNHATWCDECGGQMVEVDGNHYENHEPEDCGCEAPNQKFSLPVYEDGQIGHVRLASETNHTVHIDGGVIRDEGMGQIRYLLRTQGAGPRPTPSTTKPVPEWTPEETAAYRKETEVWYLLCSLMQDKAQEVGAEYKTNAGTYTKRLRSAVYKATKNHPDIPEPLKISDGLLSKIGQVAREFSTGYDMTVDFTRDLNQDSGEFAHEDSCWWSDYTESRCVLKNNHGFGFRSIQPRPRPYYDDVEGRVWVIPCKAEEELDGRYVLTPTGEDPDAYAVFNGYDTLAENNGPQVLAAMTGMKVHKDRVSLPPSAMYINAHPHMVVADHLVDADLRFTALYLHSH